MSHSPSPHASPCHTTEVRVIPSEVLAIMLDVDETYTDDPTLIEPFIMAAHVISRGDVEYSLAYASLVRQFFYALVTSGILIGLTLAMRGYLAHRRVDRGLCPVCSYRLRDDAVEGCPECGWGRAHDRGS